MKINRGRRLNEYKLLLINHICELNSTEFVEQFDNYINLCRRYRNEECPLKKTRLLMTCKQCKIQWMDEDVYEEKEEKESTQHEVD